jgi:hypothetical protein
MFLPINLKVSDAMILIQNTIKEMSEDNYEINDSAILYSCEDGKIINFNNIVKFSGLKNGCKVILK